VIEEQGGLEAHVTAWKTSQIERVGRFVVEGARILDPDGPASSHGPSDAWRAFIEERLRVARQKGSLEGELAILAFDYENYEDYHDEDERAEVDRRLEVRKETWIREVNESVLRSLTLEARIHALRTVIDPIVAEVRAELSPEVRWARAQKQKDQFEKELRGPGIGRLWKTVCGWLRARQV
jgi:hypothetical protein